MLWVNILLTLAVCSAMFALVRRAFHLADTSSDPKEGKIVYIVAAAFTLILLGVTVIYIPYTLACLSVAFLLCLGFVLLTTAERHQQAKHEHAVMRAARFDTMRSHRTRTEDQPIAHNLSCPSDH